MSAAMTRTARGETAGQAQVFRLETDGSMTTNADPSSADLLTCTVFGGYSLSHKLPSFECRDIGSLQCKPFAVGAPVTKAFMPVPLDARWIVRTDLVN